MAASYNTYLVQSLPTTGIDTTGLYLLYEEDGSIIKSYKRNPANTAWWFMGQYIGTAGVNNIPGANITLDIEEEDGEIWISGSSKKVDITSFVTGGTDLGITGTTGDRTITSSTGTNATIPVATGSQSGVMSAAQAGKLDGIQAGAQVNVPTNLNSPNTSGDRTITSSTGTSATIPVANTTHSGVMSPAQVTKLNGIAAGAQVNVPTNLGITGTSGDRTITSSTGTNAVIPLATTSASGLMAPGDKSKLDGIEANAQKNVATNITVSGTTGARLINSSTGSGGTLPVATSSVSGVMSPDHVNKLAGIEAGAEVNVGLEGVLDIDNEAPTNRMRVATVATAIRSLSGTGTLLIDDHTIIADALAAPITLTLPDAGAGTMQGQVFVIKASQVGNNAITIVSSGGTQIDGGTTVILGQAGAVVTLQFDGANYWVIGGEYWTVS